jgi:hypothetical protein
MISDKFVIIGALAELWGCIIYSRDTLTGKTKPNRVTWLLWFLAPSVAFAAELNKHVSFYIALTTLSVVAGPMLVFAASFFSPQAYWKLGRLDYTCGLLSLLGLLLWVIYKDSNIALVFALVADFLAAAPTLVKSFTNPETESLEAYTAAILNGGLALLAIKHWTLANYGFPAYIFMINIVFVLFIHYELGLKLQSKKA